MTSRNLAVFAACLALASCGESAPLIGVGSCNGHACATQETPIVPAKPAPAPEATGSQVPAVSSESVPAVSADQPLVPQVSAPAAVSSGDWSFPEISPALSVTKPAAPLATAADVTAYVAAQGGWRYWHTLRSLPGGVTYFFEVAPSPEDGRAGWYANFVVPAKDGSGAVLATVLLETAAAEPKAYAALADGYKAAVKQAGVPAAGPALDAFNAAAAAVAARK